MKNIHNCRVDSLDMMLQDNSFHYFFLLLFSIKEKELAFLDFIENMSLVFSLLFSWESKFSKKFGQKSRNILKGDHCTYFEIMPG
jgi:hypothetical protein